MAREYTADLDDAEVIIVNTCGFIDAAKKESIDAIVEAGRYKSDGACQAVVAVGCMVERHKAELADALPEVDLFLGASEMDRLVPELAERGLARRVAVVAASRACGCTPATCRTSAISRSAKDAITAARSARSRSCAASIARSRSTMWCARRSCSSCRARARSTSSRRISRTTDATAATAIALPELLEALVAETSIPWIRMLYLYSAGITPQLLEVMAREPRILPYLDMPMQHASDAVLARMRRPERTAHDSRARGAASRRRARRRDPHDVHRRISRRDRERLRAAAATSSRRSSSSASARSRIRRRKARARRELDDDVPEP